MPRRRPISYTEYSRGAGTTGDAAITAANIILAGREQKRRQKEQDRRQSVTDREFRESGEAKLLARERGKTAAEYFGSSGPELQGTAMQRLGETGMSPEAMRKIVKSQREWTDDDIEAGHEIVKKHLENVPTNMLPNGQPDLAAFGQAMRVAGPALANELRQHPMFGQDADESVAKIMGYTEFANDPQYAESIFNTIKHMKDTFTTMEEEAKIAAEKEKIKTGESRRKYYDAAARKYGKEADLAGDELEVEKLEAEAKKLTAQAAMMKAERGVELNPKDWENLRTRKQELEDIESGAGWTRFSRKLKADERRELKDINAALRNYPRQFTGQGGAQTPASGSPVAGGDTQDFTPFFQDKPPNDYWVNGTMHRWDGQTLTNLGITKDSEQAAPALMDSEAHAATPPQAPAAPKAPDTSTKSEAIKKVVAEKEFNKAAKKLLAEFDQGRVPFGQLSTQLEALAKEYGIDIGPQNVTDLLR